MGAPMTQLRVIRVQPSGGRLEVVLGRPRGASGHQGRKERPAWAHCALAATEENATGVGP